MAGGQHFGWLWKKISFIIQHEAWTNIMRLKFWYSIHVLGTVCFTKKPQNRKNSRLNLRESSPAGSPTKNNNDLNCHIYYTLLDQMRQCVWESTGKTKVIPWVLHTPLLIPGPLLWCIYLKHILLLPGSSDPENGHHPKLNWPIKDRQNNQQEGRRRG